MGADRAHTPDPITTTRPVAADGHGSLPLGADRQLDGHLVLGGSLQAIRNIRGGNHTDPRVLVFVQFGG